MKLHNFILILFCLILFLTSHAQKFEFPNKKGIWYIKYSGPEGPSFVGKEFVEKDTLINNLNYTIVTEEDDLYKCALRSDATKTYAINLDIQPHNEFVLYDWSLNTGDTWTIIHRDLNNHYIIDTLYFVVDRVDSVFISGNYRKRLELYQDMNNLSWIEGIGSTKGLSYQYLLTEFEESFYLLCYRESGEIVFNNGCDLTNIPKLENIDWIFFSNTEKCIYTKNVEEAIQIKLFNCIGLHIQSLEVGSNDRIDLSYLERGNYLVSWQKSNNHQSFKIIIN